MTNHKYMMEAIQLLQHHKIKSMRLPLWSYILDYSLTSIYLIGFGWMIYALLNG